jgi:hypothetical protein
MVKEARLGESLGCNNTRGRELISSELGEVIWGESSAILGEIWSLSS